MASHPDTDSRFGTELRSARKARGVSLDRLAYEMTARGYEITGASIGGWERGEYAPSSRTPVALIEEILEIDDGRLHEAMGWRPEGEEGVTDPSATVQPWVAQCCRASVSCSSTLRPCARSWETRQ